MCSLLRGHVLIIQSAVGGLSHFQFVHRISSLLLRTIYNMEKSLCNVPRKLATSQMFNSILQALYCLWKNIFHGNISKYQYFRYYYKIMRISRQNHYLENWSSYVRELSAGAMNEGIKNFIVGIRSRCFQVQRFSLRTALFVGGVVLEIHLG